ncbi:MAG: adenylosuccinate lyase family protein [bacterium]
MSVHMTESEIYGDVWGTEAMKNLFDDEPRTREWCRLIGVLAKAQAACDIIPDNAAEEIYQVCKSPSLSMDRLKEGYRETGHSMLGLIKLLEEQCDGDAGEWIYYGTTVQDITDTWLMITLTEVHSIVQNDLESIIDQLLDLTQQHRDTPMLGRTHGQAGSPITFGFKTAVWVDEMARHLDRLNEMKSRLSTGQLGGAVGGLTAYGEDGQQLRREFFGRLEVSAPDIAWINARDRIVEFFQTLTLIVSSIEKIGREVYNLQRTEIDELAEGLASDAVGSITMPHKKNPELSEHLGTLSRLVRSQVNTLTENLIHDHERDGRSWKIEWEAIPSACMAAGTALQLGADLLEDLTVKERSMQQNIDDLEGYPHSERLMIRLAREVGKQTAHEIVYELARTAQKGSTSFESLVRNDDRILDPLSTGTLDSIFNGPGGLEQVHAAVDRVLREHDRL